MQSGSIERVRRPYCSLELLLEEIFLKKGIVEERRGCSKRQLLRSLVRPAPSETSRVIGKRD